MTNPGDTTWDQNKPSAVNTAAATRLSQMIAGTKNLIDQPGLTAALLQGGADPLQAHVVDQFLGGLNTEVAVRNAASTGTKIMLSPSETAALDAMGIDYSAVQQTPQGAKAEVVANLAKQGYQPVYDNQGQIKTDARGNVVAEKIPAKPKSDGGWFGGGFGGFLHHLGNNPVTHFATHGSFDMQENGAFGEVGPAGGISGAAETLNKGYELINTTLSQAGQLDRGDYIGNAKASAANADLASRLGYDPSSPFSMLAFEAQGYAHSDTSHLAAAWEAGGNRFGWDGDRAVTEAEAYAADPRDYLAKALKDPTLDAQQKADRLNFLSSDDFQNFVRRVNGSKQDLGTDLANSVGLDPVHDAGKFAAVSIAANTVAMFATDPLNFGLTAFNAARRADVTVRNLADAGSINRVFRPTEGATLSGEQSKQIAWLKQMVSHGTAFREAMDAGDRVTAASIKAKLDAGNPYAQLLPDFSGFDRILDGLRAVGEPIEVAANRGAYALKPAGAGANSRFAEGFDELPQKFYNQDLRLDPVDKWSNAKPATGSPYRGTGPQHLSSEEVLSRKVTEVPFRTGLSDPIRTYDEAVDYLASKGALMRLAGGRSMVESAMLPGALSAYGYKALRGRMAGWSVGLSAQRAESAAEKWVLSLDEAGKAKALDEGFLTRAMPNEADAFDVATGERIAGPSMAITDAGRGMLRSNQLRYGVTNAPETTFGRTLAIYSAGTVQRAKMTVARFANWLPEHNSIDVTSNASVDTVKKIARTYMTPGDADMLASRYLAGNADTRKTIYQGLWEQVMHAAGLARTDAGKKLLDERPWNEHYSNLGDDLLDSNGRAMGLVPGHMQTQFSLPNFGRIHQASAKVGLYEATMGRLLTRRAVDYASSVWKIGVLSKATTFTRAAVESWLAAYGEGMFGHAAAVKAFLRENGKLVGAAGRSRVAQRIATLAGLRQMGRWYTHVLAERVPADEAEALLSMPDDVLQAILEEQTNHHFATSVDIGGTTEATELANNGFIPRKVRLADPSIKAHRTGFELTDEVEGIDGADTYAKVLGTWVNDDPALARVLMRYIATGGQKDRGLVLYHGGLPKGSTLDTIDLARKGAQQGRKNRTYGGFYLTDDSSRQWSVDYAIKRKAGLHAFTLKPNARVGEAGRDDIDRLSEAERAELAKHLDVATGKDLLGRKQYVLLNKDAVERVREMDPHAVIDPADMRDVVAALDASPAMRHSAYGSYFWDESGPAWTKFRAVTPEEVALGKEQWARKVATELEYLVSGRNGTVNSDLVGHIMRTGRAPEADWILDNIKGIERPKALLKPTFLADSPKGSIAEKADALLDVAGKGYKYLVERPIQRNVTAPMFGSAYAKSRVALEPWKRSLVEGGLSEDAAEKIVRDMAVHQGWSRIARLVDDPHMKSQLDVVGRSFFAFSRATTMMLRRWSGIAWRHPEKARRLMLAWEAANHTGLTYEDQNGNRMFYLPGSGVAQEVLFHATSKIPGLEGIAEFPAQDLQGRVSTIIPGSDNPFQYTNNPIVAISMRKVASMFPHYREWFDEVDRKLNGDMGQGSGALATLEPSLVKAFTDPLSTDRDSMTTSAMVGGLYDLYATGQVPKDGASPSEIDDFFRKLEVSAKSRLYVRAVMSTFSPAVMSLDNSFRDADKAFATAGIQGLRDEFTEIVNDLGGDYGQAAQIWAALHPYETVYAESGSSGTNKRAVLPATDAAFQWMTQHADFIDKYKTVAGYFIPPAKAGEPYSMSAFRAQLEQGLRQRKTAGEFLDSVRIASAATPYYAMETQFNRDYAQAKQSGDTGSASKLRADWLAWSKQFKSEHPTFADSLVASPLNVIRAKGQLKDLERMVAHNEVPGDGNTKSAVAGMVKAYTDYVSFVQQWPGSTTEARANRASAFAELQDWFNATIAAVPGVTDVYNGVFRVLNHNLESQDASA